MMCLRSRARLATTFRIESEQISVENGVCTFEYEGHLFQARSRRLHQTYFDLPRVVKVAVVAPGVVVLVVVVVVLLVVVVLWSQRLQSLVWSGLWSGLCWPLVSGLESRPSERSEVQPRLLSPATACCKDAT